MWGNVDLGQRAMAALTDDGLPPHFEVWLGRKLECAVEAVTVTRTVATAHNTLRFFTARLAGGASRALVYKSSPPPREMSAALRRRGFAREAAFYREAGALGLGAALPDCVFAGAKDGEHVVVLEAVPSSGPTGADALAATEQAFAAFAALHGRTWGAAPRFVFVFFFPAFDARAS